MAETVEVVEVTVVGVDEAAVPVVRVRACPFAMWIVDVSESVRLRKQLTSCDRASNAVRRQTPAHCVVHSLQASTLASAVVAVDAQRSHNCLVNLSYAFHQQSHMCSIRLQT